MRGRMISIILVFCMVFCLFPVTALADESSNDDGMNMYDQSDFIEKEQPELNEETKQLISLYQRNSTEENYLNLRNIVIDNYNAVLERKEEKLAELKEETANKPGGDAKVAEMEEIVQEMYMTYWNRINSSMLRFTDSRLLKWNISDASEHEYIPVMGAGESIYVKRTPVTNAEYAVFVRETNSCTPTNWTEVTYPEGEDNYPVNQVSYQDAQAYCAWLTNHDGVNTYRLPNESEWELAAGHMPKDADFNCGVNDGRTPVEQYAEVTRGAHGAVDFWGNVWEWTSTVRSSSGGMNTLAVKGGSWSSARTDCRTEYRKEGRDASSGYSDVGFRVFQVLNGEEPTQKVELATLSAPLVSASAVSSDTIELMWQPVNGATEYQLFMYSEETGLICMLDRTDGTTATMKNLEPDTTYSYIVQPLSYTSIGDNVSPEYRVSATTLPEKIPAQFIPASFAFSTLKTQVTLGSKVVIRMSSSTDVTAVTINGETAEKIFEGTKKDVYTWKATLTPAEAGNYAVNAIAYDSNGVASAPIIQNVEVTTRGTAIPNEAAATMEVYAHNGMSYWLYTPANASDNMPLIVYLHGNHSKSDDPSQLIVSDSFSNLLYEGKLGSVPAYVLIPQLNATEKGWITIREDVMDLVNTVAETFLIDRSNISLTGFSIGGSATWTIGAVYHDTFARIAPCAGSVELTDEVLQKLSNLSIWAFIGVEDTVIDPQVTRDCAAALLERGAAIQVTEYDGATHTEVPEFAYSEPNLIRWLIGQ